MNRGRPKVPNKAKIRAMRFNDTEWALLTKLGRAKWIREKLRETNELTRTN
jgi:hypothetical protein